MIWFTLILFAASFILSVVMMPKPKLENARASSLTDVRFPTAAEGNPVALVYGTVRLRGPNTIWYGDFRTVPITQKVKTGFFSSKKQITGYKYYIGLNLALCLGGPIKLTKIWAGKFVAWEGDVSTETTFLIDKPNLYGGDKERGGLKGTVAFYPGTASQSQDTYLLSKIGSMVPRYSGICHLVFRDFYIGTTTNLEPFNLELQNLPDALGLTGSTHIVNSVDSNPMEVLYDVLTNRWGRLGVSTDLIDVPNWVEAAATLYAEGNGFSLAIDKANSGKDIAEEVLRQVDGILFQDPSSGKIKIKLIRQDYTIGDLPVLDQTNVLEIRDFTKQTWSETFNQVRVTFENRDKDYANTSAVAQDFGNINFQNRVKSSEMSFPGVSNGTLAAQLASREIASASVPLFKCRLVCNREASVMRPGDAFVLSWPAYGVEQMVMRVQQFDLGELTNGRVVIQAIQDKFASDSMVFAPPEISAWTGSSRSPQLITTSKIIEAPYWVLNTTDLLPAVSTQGVLAAMAVAPGVYSQSYYAYSSDDSWATYTEGLDECLHPATATLTVAYAASTGYATGSDATGFTITGLTDSTVLDTATTAEMREGKNLILVGDEFMTFDGYTDLGGGDYQLTGIRRAVLDTNYASHSIGARVWFFSSSEFVFDHSWADTATVKVRLLDRTDQGMYDLTAATDAATVTLNQRAFRPLRPAYLTADASRTPATIVASPVALAWRERNRTNRSIQFEDDATETAEASTTYSLRWRLNGGGWTTVVPAGPSYSLTLASASVGVVDVEVSSVRDSVSSLTAATISFNVNIP